jgi:hypothetical protein
MAPKMPIEFSSQFKPNCWTMANHSKGWDAKPLA